MVARKFALRHRSRIATDLTYLGVAARGNQRQHCPRAVANIGLNLRHFVVIGAGPAGLTAAFKLLEAGHIPIVLEKSSDVGGLSRTECYKGYHFDMGGHRFYSKSKEVQALWLEWMGSELLKRQRLSRIYYNGEYFDYPLKPMNALAGLGIIEGFRIVWSYLLWTTFPRRAEETFEDWVSNRFGKRLFETFFKCYTEKVWGISCRELLRRVGRTAH